MNKKYEFDDLLIGKALNCEVINMYPNERVIKNVMAGVEKERKLFQRLISFPIYGIGKRYSVLKSAVAFCLLLTLLFFTVSPLKSFATDNLEKLMYWVASWDKGKITLTQEPAENLQKEIDRMEKLAAGSIRKSTDLSDEEISSLVGYSVNFPERLSNGYILLQSDLITIDQSKKVQIPSATYWNADANAKICISIAREDNGGYRNYNVLSEKIYKKNGISFNVINYEYVLFGNRIENGAVKSVFTQKPKILNSFAVQWEKDGIYYYLSQFMGDTNIIADDVMLFLAEDFATK